MFSVKEIIGDVRAAVIGFLIVGVLMVLYSICVAVWKSVQTQPIPWAVLIVIGVCGIVLLSIAVVNLRKASPGTLPIHVIRFDHLPKNMLECGWVRAYPKDSSIKPEATVEPDAPVSGSVAISAPAGHAYDYRLPQNAIPASRITFTAKYLNETMIFVRLALSSKDGREKCQKWVKILVGADQAYSTGGYEDQEYTLVLPGKAVQGGWRSFDLILPDVVRKTWGKHGLVFEGVTILRLRSSLEISPICFYESSF
jgi:hypothetical protein